MLPMQEVEIREAVTTTVFYDGGSNISLITHDLAAELKLKGRDITTTIRYATKDPEVVDTKLYPLTIKLNDGSRRKTILMGVESITSDPELHSVEVAYKLFPLVKKGSLERPAKPVGILFGYDNGLLIPTGGAERDGERVGDLLCYKTMLGSGQVLAGFNVDIKGTRVTIDPEVCHLRTAMTIFHDTSEMHHIHHINKQLQEMENFIFDDLGVRLPPMCKRCTGCHLCAQQRGELSREDKEVLELVKSGMTLDEETCRITARYPMNEHYYKLEDNRKQAISRQSSVEKSLIRKGMLEPYNANYQEAIDRECW